MLVFPRLVYFTERNVWQVQPRCVCDRISFSRLSSVLWVRGPHFLSSLATVSFPGCWEGAATEEGAAAWGLPTAFPLGARRSAVALTRLLL